MSIPDNVNNPQLYMKAKKEADLTYKRHGLYKSAFIVKRYKQLGGTYSGEKADKISLWMSQQWVDMNEYLDNKIVECGSKDEKGKACRPLYKKGQHILTAQEVINLHGKKKVRKIINQKTKNPNLTINWKNGTVS